MIFKKYSFAIYFAGLLMLAAGIPIWMLLMSISQQVILFAWLTGGGLKEKFIKAFTNPVVLVLTGFFFIHVLGLLNTTDFDYALRDIRIKLPFLLLPVVLSTMPPLTSKQFNAVLKVLVAATLLSTLCSVAVLLGYTSTHVEDVRDISIFISHIRLALIICVVIASLIYILMQVNVKHKFIYILLILWFIAFLVILESLTGIAILSVLTIIWCISLAWRSRSNILRGVALTSIIAIVVGGGLLYHFLFIDSIKKLVIDPKMMKQYTAFGHPYVHYPERQDHENGNPVWINICEEELDSAWNTKSKFAYHSKDRHGQNIKYTLIRYLTSVNSTKDAEGVMQMTPVDVKAVEHGIANINYLHKSDFRARLQQLAFEYRNYYYSGNPSGHSAMQRLEFWKTALYIIRKNPVTGVGTGDVQQTFNKAYVERNTKLLPEFRFHSHNQYLTMAVAFGVGGGIYFLFSLFFPFIYMNKKKDFLYCSFFIVLLLSMLTEDTPETQAGATFMAFFNSFFLFNNGYKTGKS